MRIYACIYMYVHIRAAAILRAASIGQVEIVVKKCTYKLCVSANKFVRAGEVIDHLLSIIITNRDPV